MTLPALAEETGTLIDYARPRFTDERWPMSSYGRHARSRPSCVEAYHLPRTRFERIAERKLRNRQLTDDGNIEITGHDLAGATRHSPRRTPIRPRQIRMAASSRLMIMEAERRFPVRAKLALRPGGLGKHLVACCLPLHRQRRHPGSWRRFRQGRVHLRPFPADPAQRLATGPTPAAIHAR
jgi:hypothetical protein